MTLNIFCCLQLYLLCWLDLDHFFESSLTNFSKSRRANKPKKTLRNSSITYHTNSPQKFFSIIKIWLIVTIKAKLKWFDTIIIQGFTLHIERKTIWNFYSVGLYQFLELQHPYLMLSSNTCCITLEIIWTNI